MPKGFAISVASVSAACLLGAWAVRARDGRDARKAWTALAAKGMCDPVRFSPEMVAGLPDPARRYFMYAIAPGTSLTSHVELEMSGSMRLSPEGAWMPLRA